MQVTIQSSEKLVSRGKPTSGQINDLPEGTILVIVLCSGKRYITDRENVFARIRALGEEIAGVLKSER